MKFPTSHFLHLVSHGGEKGCGRDRLGSESNGRKAPQVRIMLEGLDSPYSFLMSTSVLNSMEGPLALAAGQPSG